MKFTNCDAGQYKRAMAADHFSWLHLTDFHYGLAGQHCLWPNLRAPFLEDLARHHEASGPWDAVLFTGDFVQKGARDEFEKMQREVLDPLWKRLTELGSGAAVLLAVPGNHDLIRPDPKKCSAALRLLLKPSGFALIEEEFWHPESSEYVHAVTDVFVEYEKWWSSAPRRAPGITPGLLPGDFACTLARDGRRIGVVGLNTTFLQLAGGDYQGRLVWHAEQLHRVCDRAVDTWVQNHDACLLLTHQGPEWLTPEARKHGDTEIASAGRFAAHLFGHMHELQLDYLRRGGSPNAVVRCQGCSVFGMEKFGEPPKTDRAHGYAAGKIEFGEGVATLRLWPRIATDKPDGWRFIAAGQHAHLGVDEGTAPESVAARGGKGARPTETAAKTSASPRSRAIPSVPFAPHSTLPPRQPFFGRTAELEFIAKALQPDARGWGVVIHAAGGMGKTALALEAAYLAPAELYPLRLFLTAKGRRLDPEGPRALTAGRVEDFHTLLSEIGLALGSDDIPRAAPEQRPELIRHALATQRALLVLDNLESFTPEERRCVYDLLEILPPTCRALVTTRRRDDTAARVLPLDKLDLATANELLDSLGEKWPPVAHLTPAERESLYGETGGNPLMLTWTAGQLGRAQGRCQTVEEAIARLQEAHQHTKRDAENAPLEFIFGDLLDTFTDDETALVAALAHFTIPARVEWLLPLAALSEKAAQTALDDLRNRALLQEDTTAGTWLLPPLAARFLRDRRGQAVGTAGERLAEEAYALAVQHGGGENAPFTELEAAWPTVRAALPLLLAGDNARLQEVCAALNSFLLNSGRWDEELSLSIDAEARALAAGDWWNAGWRAYRAGFVFCLRGDGEAVLACAERCAGHWDASAGGSDEQGNALRLRGIGHVLLADYPTAIVAFEQALQLWRSLAPDTVDVAMGLNDLAEAKRYAGDLEGAERGYREALRIAQKASYAQPVALYTGNLADVFLARDDWPAAEQQAAEALLLAEAINYQEAIAENHHRLAKARLRLRRAEEALPHARKAVEIYTRLRARELTNAKAILAECEAAVGAGESAG